MSESRLERFVRLRDRHAEARLGGPPLADRDWDEYQDMMAEHREEPEPEYDYDPED